jgi:predicted DNA-binding antitoxin AbrB/MazE fold protein
MATSQTIIAIYENGVLAPLEKVRLRKRQKVRVRIYPLNGRKRKRTVNARSRKVKHASRDERRRQRIRESFGMWADRDDIGDAVEWVNQIRAGWEERMNKLYTDA